MSMIDGDNSSEVLVGTSSADTISGAGGNDVIVAGSGGDSIDGGCGNDVISGSLGSDTIDGGNGNDVIDGGSGNDLLFGGAGNDLIFGGSGSDWIDGGCGDDALFGGSGNDMILAGDGNDTVEGGSGNDTICGEAGEDVLFGGSGNDLVDGGMGRDIVVGGSGHDFLRGGAGNDVMDGGSGDDDVDGGAGNDALFGGSGNDTLTGGEGVDYLMGGSGSDRFVFLCASDSPAEACSWDRIADFTQGRDKIDLSALLDSTDLAWGNKTATANGVWYLNSGSSTFVFADVTHDGIADLKIELKNTHCLALTAQDFLGVGGSAPVANDDGATTNEDVPVTTGNVLANDSDVDNILTPASITGFTQGANGSVVYNGDGTFTYTPNANFNGPDSFTYTLSDGALTDTATVNITINAVNDAPVATVENAIGFDDGVIAGPDATGSFFDNVSDPDAGAVLTFTGIDGFIGDAARGDYGNALLLDESTGAWNYTLNAAGVARLGQGLDVDDSFEYTVVDQYGAVSSSTLNVHIDSTVAAPVVTTSTSSTDSAVTDTTTEESSSSSDPQPTEENTSTPPAGNSEPASAADNVITNVLGDGIVIPEWALLANDQSATGNPGDIESIGGVAADDYASHTPGTGTNGFVLFLDGTEFDASSFTYVANYGASSGDPVVVNVSQDRDGVIDGTSGNDILVGAKLESSSFVGNGGDDILFGGDYSDLFDYNALSDRGATGDVISGFQKGIDDLDLHDLLSTFTGYTAETTFSGYLQFVQSGDDTLVQVDGDGGANSFETLVTLDGVQLSASDTGDFIL